MSNKSRGFSWDETVARQTDAAPLREMIDAALGITPTPPQPENILGSPEFDADLMQALAAPIEPAPQIELRDYQKQAVDELVAYTPRRAIIAAGHFTGRTLALAAMVAATMGEQADTAEALERAKRIVADSALDSVSLRNDRRRAEREILIDSIREPDPPPLEKRPGHRKGYKPTRPIFGSGAKPAGSKLARKAARGKL